MASTPAFALIVLSLPFLAAAQSPAAAPTTSPAPAPGGLPDPVAILKQNGKFSTLLKLLNATGLVAGLQDKVSSPEGITIFAPTDDAFQKIASTLEKLSVDNVTTILSYHALTKYVALNKLDTLGNPVETLADGLTLNFTGGNVSSGLVNTKVGTPLNDEYPLGIFPIEDVLIPPAFAAAPTISPAPAPGGLPDPVAILKENGKFSTLLKLLNATGLVAGLQDKVSSPEGITIFAPTDDAFQKIASTLEKLSVDNVTIILSYHALTKYVALNKLDTLGNPVETLAGGLTLNFTGGNVSSGLVNTKVGTPLNDEYPLGIFPIEDVLIPPTFAAAPAPTPSGSPALTPAASPTATPPVKSPSAPAPSAASLERVGWGALVGAALACLSFY